MNDAELDVLIVQNLQDLDAAADYLEKEIWPYMLKGLNSLLESFRNQNKWLGDNDPKWPDEGYNWLAPPNWKQDDEQYRCAIYLEIPDDNHFWLTGLISQNGQAFGLRWHPEDWINKRLWRKKLNENNSLISAVKMRGFRYEPDVGTFFLPVHIDAVMLIEALRRDSVKDGLQNLSAALDQIIAAKPDLDALDALLACLT